MFVDDEPSFLEIGKQFLEHEKEYAVDTYVSAFQALDALKSKIYDTIISDYEMPEINGIDFLKSLRVAGISAPFIMFTGKGNEEVVIQALNEGADFYMQKGQNPGPQFVELAQKIKTIVSQRQSEDALRESEERFRTLLQSVPAVAVQGYLPDYKVIYWNEANSRIYGYSAEEAIGRDIRELLVPPEARDLVSHEIEKMVDTGIPIPAAEMFLTHKDGSLVPVFSSHAIVKIAGKDPILFCIDINLSERKKAEEALLDANRKLNLLATVTRENVSNLIRSSRVVLNLCDQNASNPDFRSYTSQLREYINTIDEQVEFTRLYQEIGVNNPLWHNIDHILSQITVPIQITKAATIGIEIIADPLLPQVFNALLDNSRRYGGRATEVRIQTYEKTEGLILIWDDNGAGIPVSEKERIFERGYTHYFGIGLYISREILGVTGITIKETGDPETGARFEIHIPKGYYRRIEKS